VGVQLGDGGRNHDGGREVGGCRMVDLPPLSSWRTARKCTLSHELRSPLTPIQSYIVRELIRRMDGDIEVATAPTGYGACRTDPGAGIQLNPTSLPDLAYKPLFAEQ
jgi:hypothetical protein